MTKRIDLNAPENWLKWLKACDSGKDNTPYAARRVPLGAITGTDFRVLRAIAGLWHLCETGNPSDCDRHHAALAAIALLLPHMQPSCWPFARELAAQALNWEDRSLLWPLVEPISARNEHSITAETWTCKLCKEKSSSLNLEWLCPKCALAASLGTEDKAS